MRVDLSRGMLPHGNRLRPATLRERTAHVHSGHMQPSEPVIPSPAGSRYPPGPTLLSRLRDGTLFQKNPLPFLTASARRYGDLVHFRAANRHVLQCNHPDLVSEMLLTHAAHHHRGLVMQKSQIVLGQGLLSSEDPHHMRQRRLAQPAFSRERIAGYGRVIGEYARAAVSAWKSGEERDLHQDMQLLSLRIVGKTMFNQELEADNQRIAHAIEAFMAFMPLAFLPRSELLYHMPLPIMRRIRKSRHDLDTLIYGLIAERRADRRDRGDLLSMLLASQDTEGTGGMSDEQVRDECVTALLAGNETTANGLSFSLWLLAAHPDVQARLHAEAAAALGDRTATAEDYPALPFARACFAEGMRLYPPVWTIARTVAEPYAWRGFQIPKGTILLAPQWVMHRDPRFWDEPERFRPERFLQENNGAEKDRPRFAYFPFAAGSRQCIGEGLAWMEGVLALASIARSCTLRLAAGQAKEMQLEPLVTLRPKGGVRLWVEKPAAS